MRTRIRHQSFALLVLCLTAACAPAASEGRSGSRLSEDVGQVHVTNDGRQDFVLYMLRDGVRYRLGHVARMETGRFAIPPADLGPRPSYHVQLVAQPSGMGAPAFASSYINWRPGQDLAGRVARNQTSQNFVLVTR